MLKRLLIAGALLLTACTPKTVTVTKYPEPCHLPPFPTLPDVNPQAVSKPDALPTDPPAFIVFTIPDFSGLVEWVSEVAQWKQAVELCPYTTYAPAPQSAAKEAMGIEAWHYHNGNGY